MDDKYRIINESYLRYERLFIMPYYEDRYYVEYPRTFSYRDEVYSNMEKVINLFFQQTTEIPQEMENVFWELNNIYMDVNTTSEKSFCLSFNLALKWHKLGNIEFCMDEKGHEFRFRTIR
ncbi:MAG: hypothetical protein GX213_13540 [Clostridiaceae bacterium]|nr:hypothetical protein [Clostridiaceae bacterium]